MDSMREIGLLDAQDDIAPRPARVVRQCLGEFGLAAAGREDDDLRAEEYQQACAWAAEQGMLADAEFVTKHGLEMP